MKEIILKVLNEIAGGSTGNCQINLQSESAQEMIAHKIEIALRPHISENFNAPRVILDQI
mgnify:CR=1 FL=1